MREYNFRAWIKNEGILLELLGFVYEGENCIRVWWKGLTGNTFNKSFEKSEIIIEQLTGLQDKDGQDIYEGDRVLHYPSGSKEKISFFEGSFILGKPIGLNSLIHYCCPKTIKIIGNIHENPQLLESKNVK